MPNIFNTDHPLSSLSFNRPPSTRTNQRRPQPRSQSTSGIRRSPHPEPTAQPTSGYHGETLHRSHSAQGYAPPSYAASLPNSPARSARRLPMTGDEQRSPRVPVPIFLRQSSPQGTSSKGQLKIHIPACAETHFVPASPRTTRISLSSKPDILLQPADPRGVVLIRPPNPSTLELIEDSENPDERPTDDTLLMGSLEVIMKERRRCHSISVGVQSVCRLYMGEHGWEEEGIFERGVEVLGGDAEGIWLEKGSQSFSFSILLPATLATHDRHEFARLSYIITATVEGIPATSGVLSLWKSPKKDNESLADIPFREDFERVIARSDKIAQDHGLHRTDSRGSATSPRGLSPQLAGMSLNGLPSTFDDSTLGLAPGEVSPSVGGLYHRRLSADIQRIPPMALPGSRLADDNQSIHSFQSFGTESGTRTEKQGWLTGDLHASRSLIIHANPNPIDGVTQLDLRKEGRVDGLGPWRFAASSDSFSISGVLILSLNIVAPSPLTTVFFTRVLLVQEYNLVSPRRPHEPPYRPEPPKNHVLYHVGRPHRSSERFPGHDLDCLWRGSAAGGPAVDAGQEAGWAIKAVARLPSHDKIRPSTNRGTITPIRVSHDMVWQVFYSVEGQAVDGRPIDGAGELRMMAVRMPVMVPSCCCTLSATSLPTYDCVGDTPDIDAIISSAPDAKMCQCGFTFAELGEAAMRRMRAQDQEEAEARLRGASCSPEDEIGSLKLQMERAGSSSSPR